MGVEPNIYRSLPKPVDNSGALDMDPASFAIDSSCSFGIPEREGSCCCAYCATYESYHGHIVEKTCTSTHLMLLVIWADVIFRQIYVGFTEKDQAEFSELVVRPIQSNLSFKHLSSEWTKLETHLQQYNTRGTMEEVIHRRTLLFRCEPSWQKRARFLNLNGPLMKNSCCLCPVFDHAR